MNTKKELVVFLAEHTSATARTLREMNKATLRQMADNLQVGEPSERFNRIGLRMVNGMTINVVTNEPVQPIQLRGRKAIVATDRGNYVLIQEEGGDVWAGGIPKNAVLVAR